MSWIMLRLAKALLGKIGLETFSPADAFSAHAFAAHVFLGHAFSVHAFSAHAFSAHAISAHYMPSLRSARFLSIHGLAILF